MGSIDRLKRTAAGRAARRVKAALGRARRSYAVVTGAAPRGLIAARDLIAPRGRDRLRWHPAFPPGAVDRRPPASLGMDLPDLTRGLAARHPELGVVEIADGRLLGANGWALTRRGDVLHDLTWYGDHAGEMRLPDRLPARRRLRGRVLSLMSDFARSNYGHFLLDALSRFAIFAKAGLSLDDVDHVVCPRPPAARHGRFIAALGIARERIVWADPDVCLGADTLYVTSFPGVRRDYPAWLPAFWRARLALPAGAPGRRLYIPRGSGQRRIVDEGSLHPIMAEFGIELYDPASDPDPPATFAAADLVVGAHGSGLTDILFCKPGARVLEIVPSDHAYPYYYTLAGAAGLSYGYLAGHSVGARATGAWGKSRFDVRVDQTELRRALEQWAGPPANGRRPDGAVTG